MDNFIKLINHVFYTSFNMKTEADDRNLHALNHIYSLPLKIQLPQSTYSQSM